MMKEYS